jgi:hypothetical protein
VHPHREIAALGIGRADMLGIGVADLRLLLRSDALGRAVAGFCLRVRTVNLDEHGVVNLIAN